MRLHQADHHIHALLMLHQVGVVQHVVGLAHAGRRANVDAQLCGFLGFLELDLGHRSAHLDRMMHFRCNGHRERKSERRSVAQPALHGNLAAQRLHQPPGQRQPKS